MGNLFIYLNFLNSFPVASSNEEDAVIALGLIGISFLAYFLGILLSIYVPIRLLHYLITKKPISKLEKYFALSSFIFISLGLIIYYSF